MITNPLSAFLIVAIIATGANNAHAPIVGISGVSNVMMKSTQVNMLGVATDGSKIEP